MFEDIIAQYGTKFIVAALAVLLGLACLALVLWIVRRRPSSPFIRGGRNRQPRLAVLDAAAVDTRRRLVLVRRDDVEHLLMIGGPTDIVIESRIMTAGAEAVSEQAGAAVQETAPHADQPAAMPAAARAALAPMREPAPRARPAAEERRPEPVMPPPLPSDSISSMGHVLYGEDDIPVHAPAPTQPETPRLAPGQPAPQTLRTGSAGTPTPTLPQPPVGQPATSEKSLIDALDRARDRVLTNPVGTGSDRPDGQHAILPTPAAAQALPKSAADNAALVSEFERILEAEIATSPARPASGLPPGARGEPATLESQREPPKSREETEAEMARLLGELSASRKS
ncbi:flagellar biosynthetic protein FliO [Mycoplana ramosa]|uniref:Flagellar biosynthetic protein FliO n=1 Tax=Mycoplana ramosa TaxID=40837 RepID=A0ABW3YQG9_MYCRA